MMGKSAHRPFPEGHHLLGGKRSALSREDVFAVVVELGRRGVQREEDIYTGAVARRRDGLVHNFQRLPVCERRRRKAALVADVGTVATGAEQPLQRLVYLGTGTQRIREASRCPPARP